MEQEETAMEITAKELMEMNPEELLIIDIRNEYDRNYGLIPGSVWADAQELVLNPAGRQQILKQRAEMI